MRQIGFQETNCGAGPASVHRTWMSRLQFKGGFVQQRRGSFIYSGVLNAPQYYAIAQ